MVVLGWPSSISFASYSSGLGGFLPVQMFQLSSPCAGIHRLFLLLHNHNSIQMQCKEGYCAGKQNNAKSKTKCSDAVQKGQCMRSCVTALSVVHVNIKREFTDLFIFSKSRSPLPFSKCRFILHFFIVVAVVVEAAAEHRARIDLE